jgi:hypothetical protein
MPDARAEPFSFLISGIAVVVGLQIVAGAPAQPAVEPVREIARGVESARPQQLIASGDFDEDR